MYQILAFLVGLIPVGGLIHIELHLHVGEKVVKEIKAV